MKRSFSKEVKEFLRQHEFVGCFHADSNCSKRIINAHSIQNNRILNKISDNGEVLYLDFDRDSEGREFERTGRKKATTFRGFCNYHDTTIFIPIESKDYTIGDVEQEFLFAYRALSKEYCEQMTYASLMEKFYYDGLKDKETRGQLEGEFKNHVKNIKIMKEKFQNYRQAMNANLQKKRFWKITTETVVLSKEYLISASTMVMIERDVKGNIINDLEGIANNLAPLFITIFPQNGNTYILFSYFKNDKEKYRFISQQIANQKEERIKMIVSNILVLYAENIVISPKVWEKSHKILRELFNSIYNLFMPYRPKPNTLAPFSEINLFID